MTVERSKRRSLLALTFIAKSTSKNLLTEELKRKKTISDPETKIKSANPEPCIMLLLTVSC